MKVTCETLAGQLVRVNDVTVRFDDTGECLGIVGIVARPGEELNFADAPEPLRAKDLDVFRQIPVFAVEEDEEPAAGTTPLADLSRAELLHRAKEVGLTCDLTWKKSELLAALQEPETVPSDDETGEGHE